MEFELEYVENGKYFNILNKWEIDPITLWVCVYFH